MWENTISNIAILVNKKDYQVDITLIKNVLLNSWLIVLDINENDDNSAIVFTVNWSDIWLFKYFIYITEQEIPPKQRKLNTKISAYFLPVKDNEIEQSLQLYEICIWTDIRNNPHQLYYKQLKLVSLFKDLSHVVRDYNTLWLRDLEWIVDLVSYKTLWPLTNLYTIHAVTEQEWSKNYYWLHTHWLNRCWLPELEILNVHIDMYDAMYTMLNTVILHMLENRNFKYKEKFDIQIYRNLVFLNWEEWINHFPTLLSTSQESRQEYKDNEIESAIIMVETSLLLWFGKKYEPATYYWKMTQKSPITIISNEETNRMKELCKEKYPLFKKYFQKYSTNPNWSFSLKIWIETEIKTYTDYEHLRFELESIEDDKITWFLSNQPHFLPKLKKWEIYTYNTDNLSWWSIYVDDLWRFDQDNIFILWKSIDN